MSINQNQTSYFEVIVPKIARWLLFTVIISVIPLFVNYFSIEAGKEFKFINNISKGELLLISVGIGSNSLGELLGSNAKKTTQVIFGGLMFLLLYWCILQYTEIVKLIAEGKQVDLVRLEDFSTNGFYCCAVTGLICILISE